MRIISKPFSKPESWQDCTMSMTLEKGVYVDGHMNVFYPKGKFTKKYLSYIGSYLLFIIGALMMDGFPEELREVVNEHWEKYPPQNPLVMAFFCMLFFVLWIVAFFGNFCVIYIFCATKELRSPVINSSFC